jgi:hypothetical protein
MERENLNRREFHTLAAAAVGGAIAGSMAGCSKKPKENAGNGKDAGKGGGDVAANPAEKHLCKGLNTCKGKGKDGKNDCRGMGSCATYKSHSCSGENDCKGQGGCQGKVGTNDCKKMGSCHVPLVGDSWKEAKDAFDKKHSLGKYASKKKAKSS